MCLTEYDEKKHMEAVREEGREETLELINKLNAFLIRDNRMEDLKKSTEDKEFL